jgi:hypothetical protein
MVDRRSKVGIGDGDEVVRGEEWRVMGVEGGWGWLKEEEEEVDGGWRGLNGEEEEVEGIEGIEVEVGIGDGNEVVKGEEWRVVEVVEGWRRKRRKLKKLEYL